MLTIYTDGSCINNPGPGGWAFYVPEKEFSESGYSEYTTNNKMELTAVIKALKYFNGDIWIKTDSKYVMNGATIWRENWEKRNFKKVLNVELWKKLYRLMSNRQIHFSYVKAHVRGKNESEDNKFNNIVDKIAFSAAKNI